MIRHDYSRVEPKRRANLSHKKKQFAKAEFQEQTYDHRLNFYVLPPTAEITLEEFEQWAINRLKVLSELEACTFRNKSPEETAEYMKSILDKYMPMRAGTSKSQHLQEERKRDHYSHFILRLAFAATEDLRRRFSRLETMLFQLRFKDDDHIERQSFVRSLNLEWDEVQEAEKRELKDQLLAAAGGSIKNREEQEWFKVDWEKVPMLVEQRRVFVKRGKAYVPQREQMSLVVAEFTKKLDEALELTSRALPRLDEDDRLAPILAHLSQSFTAPDAAYSSSDANIDGLSAINANSIDTLSQNFPLCMRNLHNTLHENSHLKHFGRLQYTLFLKGIGLSLDECIVFWRRSFKLMTDEKFTKEYRYNIRHAYGDVGGDSNRRGRGYTPYSCQKLLTEPLPGPGQTHGCPYRTFTPDNLISVLQRVGVNERDVLKTVREDVDRPHSEPESKLDGASETMDGKNGCSPPVEHILSMETSPAAKRKPAKPGASDIGRKRIKFTDTVEEPSQYRSTLEYYRGAKEYVPGRYVAAEGSELLDTSGSTLTFAKFTGQKKVGSKFVDIVEKEAVEDGEEPPSAAIKQGKGKSTKISIGLGNPGSDLADSEGQANSRKLRSTRQSKSTTSSAETRRRKKVPRNHGQDEKTMHEAPNKPAVAMNLTGSFETNGAILPTSGEVATRRMCSLQQPEFAEAAQDITEFVKIRQAVTKIQHDLHKLVQIVNSAQHKQMVATAANTVFDILEPLKHLNSVSQDQLEVVETTEDDSIYFEALDATSHQPATDRLDVGIDPVRGDDPSNRSQAHSENDDTQAHVVCLISGHNAFGDMADQGEQNQPIAGLDETCARGIEHDLVLVSKSEHEDHAKVADLPHQDIADASIPATDLTPTEFAAGGLDIPSIRTLSPAPQQSSNFCTKPMRDDWCVQSTPDGAPWDVRHTRVDRSNRHDGYQGLPAQSEGQPCGNPDATRIDQCSGKVPAGSGQAGQESEVVITEPNRHEALGEAQVAPGSAYSPAQLDVSDKERLL
ncbi:hypothetical protein E8E13_006128 [Curvularia kusanoi]|uniref:DNA primase large subunit C-terminal domain-containing protein n=1 Tax=Curvularia kusanoi TaxID=90978 RepID=A0A9P4WB34_CURKU|nr:hypothetical protein E8E13_006128 [Curvularia kusanoi]